MRIVVFFVYLCVLLLGGGEQVRAAMFSNNITAGQFKVDDYHKVNRTKIKATLTVFKDVEADPQQQFLISDDVEEEDSDNIFVKKCKLPVRGYVFNANLFFKSFVSTSRNSYRAIQSFPGVICYRYILLRVFRV